MCIDKWIQTYLMDPKSTLRLKRTLGSSPASLAQSSWSLLDMALVMGPLLGRIVSYISLNELTSPSPTHPWRLSSAKVSPLLLCLEATHLCSLSLSSLKVSFFLFGVDLGSGGVRVGFSCGWGRIPECLFCNQKMLPELSFQKQKKLPKWSFHKQKNLLEWAFHKQRKLLEWPFSKPKKLLEWLFWKYFNSRNDYF